MAKPIVYGSTVGVLASSFILLDQAWYDQYERSSFHFFNDGKEWLGMDKAGHVFSTYSISRYSHDVFRWTGIDRKGAIWLGGLGGFLYTGSIELLDGTSAEWGFSNWDMAANLVGSGLFISQQLLWDEQRFLPKYSAHRTPYAALRPELLGNGLLEEVFKDYNGQTYWLSYNWNKGTVREGSAVGMFLRSAVCLSAGYGAERMVGAEDNDLESGVFVPERYSSVYLSLDLDLKKIKTRSKLLNTVFSVLNGVKVPAPALEYTSQGALSGHWLYF